MDQQRRCPRCSAELPPDAPDGICPQCLVRLGIESEPPGEPDPGNSETPSTATDDVQRRRFQPPRPEQLQQLFPQLEILALLGCGGMGAVYKARQVTLDRIVALKILPSEAAADPTFAERFAREARALARLTHPNIVLVFEFGQAEGLYYFVMEYVDGVNLRQTLQAGKLSPQEALKIVPQICEALQYAHDEGIVHRDIKPENVLMDKKGRVKIADFGLAKLLGRAPLDLTLTASHQVMGTVHYMAPEQMERPLAVDHRADIYSLGVVFYELLTGELPLGRFAPPSAKVDVDDSLDEVVLRTLEKEPERRYQKASEVKTAVELYSSQHYAPRPAVQAAERYGEPAPGVTASFPDVPSLRGSPDHGAAMELARRQLRGPAVGLLLTGCLDLFSLLAIFVLASWSLARAELAVGWFVLGASPFAPALLQEARPVETSLSPLVFGWILLGLVQVPLAGLLILGSVKMLKLELYGVAVLASVLAMLPCHFGFLIGLPIGIWSLTVLLNPEVRAVFRRPGQLADRHLAETRPAAAVPPKPQTHSTLIVEARRKLKIPAVGLMVAGGVQAFGWIAVVGLVVLGTGAGVGLIKMLIFLIPAPLGLLMIVGGAQMLTCRSYAWAMVAAVAALFPCSVLLLLNLPFGIWSLILLRNQEIREAFQQAKNSSV